MASAPPEKDAKSIASDSHGQETEKRVAKQRTATVKALSLPFYDLCVDATIPLASLERHAAELGIKGMCLCGSNALEVAAQRFQRRLAGASSGSSFYTRIDLPYTPRLDQSAIQRLRNYDIVCITTGEPALLPTIAKLAPDMVRVEVGAVKHLKKAHAGLLKEKGIFLELQVGDGLEERVQWLQALRRLLWLRSRSILVLTSGATGVAGLRSGADIAQLLVLFGMKERTAQRMAVRGRVVLERAAERRYLVEGAVALGNEETQLKHDFIISKFK